MPLAPGFHRQEEFNNLLAWLPLSRAAGDCSHGNLPCKEPVLKKCTAGKYTLSDTEDDTALKAQPTQTLHTITGLGSSNPQTPENDLCILMFTFTPLKISNKIWRCKVHTVQELQSFSITFPKGGLLKFHVITKLIFLQQARSVDLLPLPPRTRSATPTKVTKQSGKASHCSAENG